MIDGIYNVTVKTPINGNEFTMQGNMRMFTFGHFAYNIKGEVEGRKLHAIAETSRGTFSIQGTRI